LVGRINVSTAPAQAGHVASTIGVLDIFGTQMLTARLSFAVQLNDG